MICSRSAERIKAGFMQQAVSGTVDLPLCENNCTSFLGTRFPRVPTAAKYLKLRASAGPQPGNLAERLHLLLVIFMRSALLPCDVRNSIPSRNQKEKN